MDNKKRVGNRIRTLREAKGLLQKELAKELEVGLSSVSKWETGAALPKSTNFDKITAFFKAPMKYFYASDAEAERMLYKTDRPEKQETIIETVPASQVFKDAEVAYEKHQLKKQIGKLEAELRGKATIIEEYRIQLDAKDAEIAGLRKRYCGKGSLEADIRARDEVIKAKDEKIAELNDKFDNLLNSYNSLANRPTITNQARQILQLSIKMLETFCGTVMTEDPDEAH